MSTMTDLAVLRAWCEMNHPPAIRELESQIIKAFVKSCRWSIVSFLRPSSRNKRAAYQAEKRWREIRSLMLLQVLESREEVST